MPLGFDKNFNESVHCFVYYGHFNNINSSNLWTQDVFPFIFIWFNFFDQHVSFQFTLSNHTLGYIYS